MAYIVQGKKLKRLTSVFGRCLDAGAAAVKFDERRRVLEVEWPGGIVAQYGVIESGFDTRFDPQLDVDLKAG